MEIGRILIGFCKSEQFGFAEELSEKGEADRSAGAAVGIFRVWAPEGRRSIVAAATRRAELIRDVSSSMIFCSAGTLPAEFVFEAGAERKR